MLCFEGLMKYQKMLLCAFLTIVPMLFCTPLKAETVYLKNGDKVTGDITSLPKGQGINLKTSFGAFIYIPWSHIEKVANQSQHVIVTPPKYDVDAAKQHITLLLEEDSKTAPKPKGLIPKAKKTQQDPKLKTAKKTLLPIMISGRASFGGSIQTGNSEKNKIAGDLSLKSKKDKHRFQVKANFNRAKDEGEITVDKAKAEFIYDYFYTKKWFVNSNVGAAQDNIANVDLRTTGGLGIGHQVYERDNLNLQYIMGATYLNEEFANQISEDNISVTWSFDYDQKIINDKYQLFHEHKLLAPSDDFGAFLFASKSGLRIPLIKGMIGTTEIIFDWDNDPALGATEDDTIYNMKLGYEW